MAVASETEWIEPYEGFTFQETSITADAAEQARALACCGIDAEVFAGDADPAFFIAHAIAAGVANGISADGSVNMVQNVSQHRPVPLDTPLTVNGRVLSVQDVPRGKVSHTEVWFCDADGARVLTADRRSLRPDPARAGVRGAGERPAPVVADPMALEEIGGFAFKPDAVKAYNSSLNPIHYEPEAAPRPRAAPLIIAIFPSILFIFGPSLF